MQANKSRDTSPELALRHELFKRGMRYRVGFAPLPGVRRSVDIAFPAVHVAVMVDGCFWHGCPEHYRTPKSHTDYWQQKVARNQERDTDTTHRLTDAGWTVLRFWEHEPLPEVADVVEQVVAAARQTPLKPKPGGSGSQKSKIEDLLARRVVGENHGRGDPEEPLSP